MSRNSSRQWITWRRWLCLGALSGLCLSGHSASETPSPAPQNPVDLVRRLRSLQPGLKASTYDELRDNFRNPTADFRAMPLWVWNDELDWNGTPSAPNVLVLDYCDLDVAGRQFTDLNTWRANWNLWQAHGFQRPVWDDGVQFRRRVIDRTDFPPDSGFAATFRFAITDAQAMPAMQLAIESPELYRVSVNGGPVDFAKGSRWLDPHIASADIGRLVQVGENTVRIEGRPFNVRMELKNIYLRGNFAVKVVSTPRNMFGPFHNPEKPRMRAWPALWTRFPTRQP